MLYITVLLFLLNKFSFFHSYKRNQKQDSSRNDSFVSPVYRTIKKRLFESIKPNSRGMKGYLSPVRWSPVPQIDDPEKACCKVTNTIHDAMEIYILSKSVTENTGDDVWFGDICRKATTRKRRLLKKFKENSATFAVTRSITTN